MNHLSTINQIKIGRPVLFGGLTVGVLDGLAAIIFNSYRGIEPASVFQYISSGLVGSGAFSSGLTTVILGILLHFCIAGLLTIIFYSSSFKFKFLQHRPIPFGMIYGIIVYFVMNYIVIPLSLASLTPFSFASFLFGITVHALFVGLPIGLTTKYGRKN